MWVLCNVQFPWNWFGRIGFVRRRAGHPSGIQYWFCGFDNLMTWAVGNRIVFQNTHYTSKTDWLSDTAADRDFHIVKWTFMFNEHWAEISNGICIVYFHKSYRKRQNFVEIKKNSSSCKCVMGLVLKFILLSQLTFLE